MTPAPTRTGVRDSTAGGTAYAVEFDARTVYDFLISLAVGDAADEDLLPEDRRWLAEARASLTSELASQLVTSFGGPDTKGLGVHLAELAFAHPEAADSAGFLAVLRKAEPREVARVLVEEILRYEELEQHLDGALDQDTVALKAIEGTLPDKVREPVMAVLRAPDAAVSGLLRLLEAWQERFRSIEPRLGRMLSNDVATRRADAATLDPPDLLERVTGGIRLLADPGLRRVVLAPSYFSRPYNFVFSANDWRLFCYPIADASLDGAEGSAPPPQIVRLYRALGDESRMRILKLLTERDHYLTELAQELELSKPTVKHHLTQLRAAGVVTMTEEGSLTYYSLRRQRLEEAGVELDRYLS